MTLQASFFEYFAEFAMFSLVESEHPVAEGEPEGGHTGDGPEAAMIFGSPLPDVLVRAVAEGRVRRHLTIAQLVVATFAHVERHRPTTSQNPLALPIAHRVYLRVATGAPIVRFAAS